MVSRRKKSLWRRIRHRLKPIWRKYWSVGIAIILGLFTAFYVIPNLVRFLPKVNNISSPFPKDAMTQLLGDDRFLVP
jgi:hypothetical protein